MPRLFIALPMPVAVNFVFDQNAGFGTFIFRYNPL